VLTWLVRSAILILYPRTALPGIAECGLDAYLVQFRRETPRLMWVGVVLGSLLFHLTPVFTVFVPLPAFWLPAGLRDKHAAKIAATSLYLPRQLIFLVKFCAGLCWGTAPEVRARFNLRPLPADPGTWRPSSATPSTAAPAAAVPARSVQ
jgi:hypothetical protein